jgi:hypothetical protein
VNANAPHSLAGLDARIKTLLPEEYRDSYEKLEPTPMRSAGLKYDADGQVAWDQIWGSFCDLAMAGGPPHKGALLEPGTEAAIDAEFGRYDAVAEEICRGITMATGLRAYVSPTPGWISVSCHSDAMAGWLLRAIVMENVAVRQRGSIVELPAAPHFRLEKEIKNVVTVIAKTSHYWLGHMPREQQQAVGNLFAAMGGQMPLVGPDLACAGESESAAAIALRIHRETGLRRSAHRYAGWVGVECPSVRAAVWMMRALVASNILARREQQVLFVPVNAAIDPTGAIVSSAVADIYELARTV